MTVNPGSGQNVDGSSNTTVLNQDGTAGLARAYLETYQGPHGDAPEADFGGHGARGPIGDRQAGVTGDAGRARQGR